ncbi:efflux RND transporter periplasmic adaptor subunit [Hymenobacter properus]|uniref:Efflux RND transporter periplasmic adaptor subunit n=1 Tax=Hymenobacter properus TaxID=2791026 RepID=A0A931BI08_9BACT|nr:efflux RND transporter periplasmic adaptor subunit [Hymenobacter properus]MBF9141941.1 efflux RND transporter periplasmic adaptor subunit [Hymenobacter properus]MBR7720748.1 efflux RND transporter periplasmic adaptor subunit [Microvirga sp. SRT04]
MIQVPFHPMVAGVFVFGIAAACSSTPDQKNAKAAARTANEYAVLTLTPQTANLHVDYPASLQEQPGTGNMRAYFLVNEKAVQAFEWHWQDSTMLELLWQMSNVQLVLPNGTVYAQRGRVDRTKGQVDPATGSVAVKATFPNANGVLRTGGKGLVRLPLQIPKALLVPPSATYERQGKHLVYVVGADNKVRSTEVKVLPFATDSGYVVQQGLKAGDRVVFKGVRSLQEGQLIVPSLAPVVDTGEAL